MTDHHLALLQESDEQESVPPLLVALLKMYLEITVITEPTQLQKQCHEALKFFDQHFVPKEYPRIYSILIANFINTSLGSPVMELKKTKAISLINKSIKYSLFRITQTTTNTTNNSKKLELQNQWKIIDDLLIQTKINNYNHIILEIIQYYNLHSKLRNQQLRFVFQYKFKYNHCYRMYICINNLLKYHNLYSIYSIKICLLY